MPTIARIEEIIAGGTDPMLTSWLESDVADASQAVLRGGRT